MANNKIKSKRISDHKIVKWFNLGYDFQRFFPEKVDAIVESFKERKDPIWFALLAGMAQAAKEYLDQENLIEKSNLLNSQIQSPTQNGGQRIASESDIVEDIYLKKNNDQGIQF